MAQLVVEMEGHDCDGVRYLPLSQVLDVMEAVSRKMWDADINAVLLDAVMVQLKFYQMEVS
jgi:hypothetical protein